MKDQNSTKFLILCEMFKFVNFFEIDIQIIFRQVEIFSSEFKK